MRVLPPDDDGRAPSRAMGFRALAAVLLLGVLVTALYLGVRGGGSDTDAGATTPTAPAIDVPSQPVSVGGQAFEMQPPGGDGEVSLPGGLSAVAAAWDGSRFWALAVSGPPDDPPSERALLPAIDPETDEVLRIPLEGGPTHVAAGPGGL